jgi:transposase, IS30 family
MAGDGLYLYSIFYNKKAKEEQMPKGYHHLTNEKRCQLYILMKRGDSKSTIADELNIHRSTVYREVARNSGLRGYRYRQAHCKAMDRRESASCKKLKMSTMTISIIEEKLNLQWSPEQISGWLKKIGYRQAISHEWIYQHVWANKKQGGTLYKELRYNGKKYNKRRSGKAGRGCIPNRRDIKERPPIVEDKVRVGDWELDTIIGKGHKGAIVSMVDRASKFTQLFLIPRKSDVLVRQALTSKLKPIKECVLTLTSDNGKEFAGHQSVSRSLEADFFFATPYRSWERGLNEHTNGLVRQYFPKKKSFLEIRQEEVERVEFLLNNRPRKVLNYMTPIEAFEHLRRGQSNVAFQT